MQSGTYTVTVKLSGFRTFTRAEVPVTLNNVSRVDVSLQVGQLSETVLVAADAPILQTDRAEVRSELKTRELVNLPVSMNRNYQYLFRVLPGFTPPAEAHSVPSNPSRALVFNVNGASRRWRYNQYGGTVGGPLVHNRVFYFVSYEGTRDHQVLNRTVSVPTEAVRRGNLSASSTQFTIR